MRSRLVAWLITGPVGHGYAGCLDATALLRAVARARLRSRHARTPDAKRPDVGTAAAAVAAQPRGSFSRKLPASAAKKSRRSMTPITLRSSRTGRINTR